MNRRVADSALLPYERQGSIVTYVTAVASAEKGARCALIFILGGSLHRLVNDRRRQTKKGARCALIFVLVEVRGVEPLSLRLPRTVFYILSKSKNLVSTPSTHKKRLNQALNSVSRPGLSGTRFPAEPRRIATRRK